MSLKRDKWVRRFSVDETAKHKNGFTIYKITSVLFPLESPEAVTLVSVWKRYSDVQKLHKTMKSLHAGLHLAGVFPSLVSGGYFKRFQQDTIGDRAKSIKALLEFIAEHRLLFTSTDFVAFLQSGYPAPRPPNSEHTPTQPHTQSNSSSLTHTNTNSRVHTNSHAHTAVSPLREGEGDNLTRSARSPLPLPLIPSPETNDRSRDEIDFSRIPIYEPFDVELRESPKPESKSDSFESIGSIESLGSDIFEELDKIKVEPKSTVKKKNKLPDLIDFDAPSTSRFDDYHTTRIDSETVSLNSTLYESTISEIDSRSSKLSSYKTDRSMPSLSNIESKTRTEDSYVFEAGYLLNLAARSEDAADFQNAFDYYKAGIEKMLIGVQTDSDSRRRALIKKKTNKYLSYAENIYKNHLCNNQEPLLPPRPLPPPPPPPAMLRREYSQLAEYTLVGIVHSTLMLVLSKHDNNYYVMKVIQKIPTNLTEFDDYFLQNTNSTRQPILPTLVPYMVQLHAYIETDNLIFLLLTYAPGEKLIDYIINYEKTAPNTPIRQVNLENVFSEPKTKTTDLENNVSVKRDSVSVNNNDSDMSVNQLVVNSKMLLLNVDRALSDSPNRDVRKQERIESEVKSSVERIDADDGTRRIPPRAVVAWGAEILTAIDGLHNCGVICRDLNPSNILLTNKGHITLTYFTSHSPRDVITHTHSRSHTHMYVAPELYYDVWSERDGDRERSRMERVADYWSFGAVMYELICGVPLSYYHRSIFTSHTILQLPDNIAVEAQSLLSQLLTYDPRTRLGSGPDGINEIRSHPYFKNVHWEKVYSYWETDLMGK